MRALRARRGISLIEIVLAMVLLAFCLGPMLVASTSSIRKTGYDGDRVLGVNLALRLARQLSELPYDRVAELGDEGFDPEALLASPVLPTKAKEHQAEFEKDVTFRELVPGEVGMLEVEVRWKVRPGAPWSRAKASSVVVHPYRRGAADSGE